MKSTAATPPRNSNTPHPPLAHDAQGNPIAVPDGTTSWMLKRQTTGRPKILNGPDRRPLRLPLDTTAEEILETYGPGMYRVDALDSLGNPLDHVTTFVVGEEDTSDDETEQRSWPTSRSDGSDLRFALQTITQMAQAQARSLEAVAEAQADWVRGLASARALPRNAAYAPPAQAQLTAPVDHDDDDDDESGHASALESAATIAQAAHGIVEKAIAAFQMARVAMKTDAPASVRPPASAPTEAPPTDALPTNAPATSAVHPNAPPPTNAPNPMVHLSEINERLSAAERRVLRQVLRGENVDVVTRELLARSVDDVVAWIREGIAVARRERSAQPAATAAAPESTPGASSPAVPAQPPAASKSADIMVRVNAVAMLLPPEDRAELVALLPRISPQRLAALKEQLLAMTVEDAVAWIRTNLAALKAEVAS